MRPKAGALSAEDGRSTPHRDEKFLTFRLAEEDYGISIRKIREIIGMMPITSVPRTDEFVKGVINLRGKVIPVVDLRRRFGMGDVEPTERTCIVVVNIAATKGTVLMGLVVDSVSEVLNIQPEDIEEPPEFGAKLQGAYIQGMAKMDGAVKILVDIDAVFGRAEVREMRRAARS